MSAREEKRAAFNEQMNAWVSRQGLWFQLRHAADGQSMMSRIARVFARFLILLIIFGAGILIYLVKRTESEGFRENIRASIEVALNGDECTVGAFRKERGVARLSFVKMRGTDQSFFHTLEARGVNTNMKLTDGVLGSWNGQGLTIDFLNINVKAGAEDDAIAAEAFGALFVPQDGFKFERIECKDTNINWGYSGHNLGYISGSHLIAGRVDGGWKLEFRGGTFGQGWLKDLMIKKMVVLCSSDGVHISEAQLTSSNQQGSISFRASLGSGGKPSVQGTIQLDSMPVNELLSSNYSEWIQGSISGKGLISGSTNSQEGVVFDLDLSLQDGEMVSVRQEGLPILSALTVVDLYNSYRKVSFDKGALKIRTSGDTYKISKLNLDAAELLHLRGEAIIRPPSHEEIAKTLDMEDSRKVQEILYRQWEFRSDDTEKSLSNDDSNGRKNEPSMQESLDKVLRSSIMAELAVKRFDGELKFGLKPDAFDSAEQLKAKYPMDSATNKIWVEVPLEGRLQTLTLKQAEQLYKLGRAELSN